MFIPDPDFFPSRIPDPKKKHGEVNKFFIHLFSHLFVAFRSCWNRSWLITVAHFHFFHFLTQEIIGFKLSEIMVGSGIRKKPIPDPGVKKDPDPKHWNLDPFGKLLKMFPGVWNVYISGYCYHHARHYLHCPRQYADPGSGATWGESLCNHPSRLCLSSTVFHVIDYICCFILLLGYRSVLSCGSVTKRELYCISYLTLERFCVISFSL